jgi:hypothetical protein
MAKQSFTAAMNKAFRTPGQPLGSFSAELKALDRADKLWFHRELNKSGIECESPIADAPHAEIIDNDEIIEQTAEERYAG